MDSNEVKKKFVNDITPPENPKVAPSIDLRKRQTITVNASSDESENSLLLPPAEFVADKEPISAPTVGEKVITPPPPEEMSQTEPALEVPEIVEDTPVVEQTAQATPIEAPAVNPLPEQKLPEPVIETPEIEDKDIPVSEIYQASDALPDESEKTASDLKDGMQEPKLYDTTAYHVPIKETHHGHGSAKAALVFGALCAVVVLVAAIYYMVQLGS